MVKRSIVSVDLSTVALPGDIVAIVGAGGKTTTMFALSRSIAASRRRVITTKSTVIYQPTMARSPYVVTVPPDQWSSKLRGLLDQSPELTVVIGTTAPDRWAATPACRIRELRDASGADNVIVEADGARGRLLKAPAAHEPSMPPDAAVVMPVVSLQAIGRPLSSTYMHRPEMVGALLNLPIGDIIRLDHLSQVLLADAGGLKLAPKPSRIWPVLTHIDHVDHTDAINLINDLAAHPRVTGVVTADRTWQFAAFVRATSAP